MKMKKLPSRVVLDACRTVIDYDMKHSKTVESKNVSRVFKEFKDVSTKSKWCKEGSRMCQGRFMGTLRLLHWCFATSFNGIVITCVAFF